MAELWLHEWHRDVRLDIALDGLIRHHTSDADEYADAVAFCREPFQKKQLDILFRRMGGGIPLKISYIKVDRKQGDTILRAYMRLTDGVTWQSGRLIMDSALLPETLATALPGRPLSDIIVHPYLPADLTVGKVEKEKTGPRWVVKPIRIKPEGSENHGLAT